MSGLKEGESLVPSGYRGILEHRHSARSCERYILIPAGYWGSADDYSAVNIKRECRTVVMDEAIADEQGTLRVDPHMLVLGPINDRTGT
jgi:hypothetical protein